MIHRPFNRLSLVCCLLFLLLRCAALSQINVELQLARGTYLVDENTVATLRITNMAGRDITLGENENAGPWCQIQVSAVRGESPLPRRDNPTFPPLFIASGESVSRGVNINDVYDISLPGHYRVKASINYGEGRNAIVSAPAYFITDPGKTIWSTTVGIPEDRSNAGGIRTFSVIQLQRKEGIFLYAKLEDRHEGWRFPPYLLGRMLSAMLPQAQIDRDNNLYVFHAIDDESYMLSQIDISTGRSGQATYRSKTPRNGRPSLNRTPEGKLVISGGIRITEEEMASKTAPERAKLSDRPAGFDK